jgi:hypothetical protein
MMLMLPHRLMLMLMFRHRICGNGAISKCGHGNGCTTQQ